MESNYKDEFEGVIELEQYTQKLCRDAEEFLEISRTLYSECQKAEKRALLMMEKPISTLDKTLYMLMLQSDRKSHKPNEETRSLSAMSNKKTNKMKMIPVRNRQRNANSRMMTPEKSHIEELEECKRNPNEKYYCACKGRKALTF